MHKMWTPDTDTRKCYWVGCESTAVGLLKSGDYWMCNRGHLLWQMPNSSTDRVNEPSPVHSLLQDLDKVGV